MSSIEYLLICAIVGAMSVVPFLVMRAKFNQSEIDNANLRCDVAQKEMDYRIIRSLNLQYRAQALALNSTLLNISSIFNHNDVEPSEANIKEIRDAVERALKSDVALISDINVMTQCASYPFATTLGPDHV